MSDQLSVVLTVDDNLQRTLRENEGVLSLVQAYSVDSPAMADLANDELRGVKQRIVRLKELKAGFVEPAKKILENASALFDKPLFALGEAEKVLKGALLTWQQEQERIAAEARRKAQEDERERRQKAEREAAAARAKAEQEAAEQLRIAREAEEARRLAVAEGNAREAARAAAQAAAATAKADAAVENGNAKAAELVLAAEASTKVVEAPRKPSGFSAADNWLAEFAEGVDETSVVPLLVTAIAEGRKDLIALLK